MIDTKGEYDPEPAKHVGSTRRMRREAERQRRRVQDLELEVERLRKEVERLSVYEGLAYDDHLTGLRNRRYFEERLRQELARARREGTPCSVLVADVNDFKQINDRHGHTIGDLVLRRVGALLIESQREMDVPCRIGGDEFAVILPATDVEGAQALRERLERAMPDLLGPAYLVAGLTASLSFGTATYPTEAATDDLLVSEADRAMYADKRARKDSDRPDNAA